MTFMYGNGLKFSKKHISFIKDDNSLKNYARRKAKSVNVFNESTPKDIVFQGNNYEIKFYSISPHRI